MAAPAAPSLPLTSDQAARLVDLLIAVMDTEANFWPRIVDKGRSVQRDFPGWHWPEPPHPETWAAALIDRLENACPEGFCSTWRWSRLTAAALSTGNTSVFERAMALLPPRMVGEVLVSLAQDEKVEHMAHVLVACCDHADAKASLETPMVAVMGATSPGLLSLFLKTFEPQEPLRQVMTAAIHQRRDDVVQTFLERRYPLHLAGPLRAIAETGCDKWLEPVLAAGVDSRSDLLHGLRSAIQHSRTAMAQRLMDLIDGPLTVSDPLVAAANNPQSRELEDVLARTPQRTVTQAYEVMVKSEAWEGLARLARHLPRSKVERWVAQHPHELRSVTARWRQEDVQSRGPGTPSRRRRV